MIVLKDMLSEKTYKKKPKLNNACVDKELFNVASQF